MQNLKIGYKAPVSDLTSLLKTVANYNELSSTNHILPSVLNLYKSATADSVDIYILSAQQLHEI